MCETMANIPVEEKSSYVLTEDMIDAAMNEQFAFQEDLESEEESSSLEGSIEVDQDSQESCTAENVGTVASLDDSGSSTNSTVNTDPSVNVNVKAAMNISPSNSPVSNNNKVSVLVIETGLDKNGSDYITSTREISHSKEKLSTSTPNGSFNESARVNNVADDDSVKTVGHETHSTRETKADLTILKSILSEDQDKDGIIDLCDSEVDDFSEDDLNESETIDDELRSVMETNLMAEIGMTVNKKPGTGPSLDKTKVEKPLDNVTPKISVKNISQISSHAFNRLPQSNCVNSSSYPDTILLNNSKINENQSLRSPSFPLRNTSMNANIPTNGNNQGPSPIHINKIAVPHSTFVNSQGQKMKCVYVKSTATLPFVINTPTQTTASNANVKYVFTHPMKKGPIQMPAITALKNLTKNLQPQKLVLPKNAKVLTVSQKLQRSQTLQNGPAIPQHKVKKDNQALDALKMSLIFVQKVPYSPPNTFPENTTYSCLECNDKFIFKSSLTNHIERRSISIRYWCPMCKSNLQFYNRCALSIHVQSHNNNLKQLDTLNYISVSSIPKEMVDKGLATSFLKDSDSIQGRPLKTSIFCPSDKVSHSSIPNSSPADLRLKAISTVSSNVSSNKITTVAGQSKSVCYQTPSSSEGSRPIISAVANSQASKKMLPILLPKSSNQVQTLALVSSSQPLQNQAKEHSINTRNSPPKSLILFCNKLPQPLNVEQSAVVNATPPNDVCEVESKPNSLQTVTTNDCTEIIVDDDVALQGERSKSAEEEEIVDVENIDANVTSTSGPELEVKSLLSKGKRDQAKTSSAGSKKRNCSECKQYCANISKHLNGTNRPTRADLACKICNLILPTKCSLKIHHRIHMKIPPYKCPDCGKDFTTWDDLHAHLKFSCGHFAKCVRHICTGCKAHFPTKIGLAQHIVKNHGKDIYKCSLCPVAFYKKPSLIKHIFNDHCEEKNKSQIGMDYKQCSMCPKKLLPEESFFAHAQEHSNSMIYGFKCSMCNIVYANKMAFIIHQIKEKTKKGDSGKSGHPSKSTHTEEEAALEVSDSNSDYEDEPVIVRKYPEINSDSSITEKDPLSLDDWECTQEQKVKEKTEELCIVCKKNSVVLLPEIDLNSQSLCCKQCVKPLDDDNPTEFSRNSKGSTNHIINHSKSNKQRQSNPKNIYRSSSVDEVKRVTKKRRISDISLNSYPDNERSFDPLGGSPSKKKSRKKTRDKLDPKGQTHIQDQVIKSKSFDDLCHKCPKCEFVAGNRELFQEHITVHRTDPNSYQCLECGLCFVVLPSLERHLQMHHGIKDASSYTETNRASLPQKVVPVEQETQDNQCHVCYEMFDCKSSLDKHFRIHGMAFMNQLSKSP